MAKLAEDLTQFLRKQLAFGIRGHGSKRLRRMAVARFVCYVDAEPVLEGGMDQTAVRRADVRAVSGLGRLPAQFTAAMRGLEASGRLIKPVNRFQPFPDRIALAVP